MWKEWLNPYNTFNGIKALVHREQLLKIVEWRDRKAKNLPPPVMLVVDPTNLCNVNCTWCETRDFRQREARSITDPVLLEIPGYLKAWGVKAIEISGGEPLMHPKITEFLNALGKVGISIGLKTNGYLLGGAALRKAVLNHVRWIGISLDAATGGSYLNSKRANVNAFDKVIENIKWLTDTREDLEHPRVAVKYLIHHNTYSEMYVAADLARMMKVNEVHFRPFYQKRYRFAKGVRRTAAYYLREARRDFETADFKIYGIVYKFEMEWDRAIRFEKCYASALSGVFAADEQFYLCADCRGDNGLCLGKFHPFDTFKKKWGGEEHWKMVQKISPQLCPKCGLSAANEVVEKCIIRDDMLLDFI